VSIRRIIGRLAPLALAAWLVVAPSLQLHGETFIWVDDDGITHFSDDPDAVPNAKRSSRAPDVDRLRALWGNDRLGPIPQTPRGGSSSQKDRVIRLVAGAVDDLGRGETARALAALRSAVRIEPSRPEPYWYLALVDRQRGRYASATKHLDSFLSTAGPELDRWRSSARRRLALLEDERRLADETVSRGPLRLVAAESQHFSIQMDSELSEVSADYASTALGYLDDARQQVSQTVGVEPLEPLGVVFYGRAAYTKAFSHRFSFQTVGFFDGRIHVSSPAHPSGELRSLLFHEYTHAVFRDRTGGDRPYWLNEGLAEQIERMARHQPPSTRSERASLRRRILAHNWIPLRRLAPSFSGLSNEDARAAYLEAVVSVEWIDSKTDREQRRRLLERIGAGLSTDQALYEALGLDTEGVDRAVQQQILSEFPEVVEEPQPAVRPTSS
jgi:tetratricopeptide (TPR) repeat protein